MELQGAFWGVLCLSVVIYWLLPRGREWFLIAVSFLYLSAIDLASRPDGAFTSVPLTLVWFALFYFLGKFVRARTTRADRLKLLLILSALAYLAYFKYFPPFIVYFFSGSALAEHYQDMLIPLGISYVTFKLIHYIVDASYGKFEGHSPRDLLLYLVLFTIFPAGPIERFDHFLENRHQQWDWSLLAVGGRRIIFGLIKKFVLAELVVLSVVSGIGTGRVLENLDEIPTVVVWCQVFLWFLYFYLDFAAYSDIAIGASRLFGFEIMENFNHPLMAVDIADFWQRWHMTLVNWCRTYVYLPMIGWTRNPFLAIYATMLVVALWHTASFGWIFWGLYHATGLVLFRLWQNLKRRWKISISSRNPFVLTLSRVVTLAFVSASYSFLITQRYGAYQSVRLFCALFGIVLPQGD